MNTTTMTNDQVTEFISNLLPGDWNYIFAQNENGEVLRIFNSAFDGRYILHRNENWLKKIAISHRTLWLGSL